MVKVVNILNDYTVMLDVGGAIFTVHSMRPDEIEIMLGGTERKVTVSSALEDHVTFNSNTLYLRYKSNRTPTCKPLPKQENGAPSSE
jgi:hypothetical protein